MDVLLHVLDEAIVEALEADRSERQDLWDVVSRPVDVRVAEDDQGPCGGLGTRQ
jgi:hypothetical protein